jgi:murE/murF fusion protein
MLLQNYIPNINKNKRTVFFSGIAFDSNDVKKDNIFFAIKGNSFDGNDYIDLAIKRGAKIIISEKKKIKKKKDLIY